MQMQKSKMNANSRRILERKQLRAGESGDGTKIVNGQVVRLNEGGDEDDSVSPDPRARRNTENVNVSRKNVKSVPTGSLNLNAAKRRDEF